MEKKLINVLVGALELLIFVSIDPKLCEATGNSTLDVVCVGQVELPHSEW